MKDIIYADFVNTIAKDMGDVRLDLVHFSMGVSGEAGELLDAVKKHWAYNKPLDEANVIEELGDLEFYMQAIRNRLKLKREDIIAANIDKLMARYPQGTYSDKDAQERKDKA